MYPYSTPTDKESEKASSEISSKTQSQHSLPRMDYINLRNLSTYNILTQIFKRNSWQNLCKQVSKIFNCINLKRLDTTLKNILTKPNSIDHIELNTWSELG